MPTRGYRKGVSDAKTPVPKRIHTRLPQDVYACMQSDCESRSLTACAAMRAIVSAHYRNTRAELPHARGPSSGAIRELCRIGNNLNQIAHQAHLMNLHLIADEARAAIAAINAAVRRLG